MEHRRRRRHIGGSEPAPLTPAQVQALRARQDTEGVRLVRMFILACLAGGIAHAALFMSMDGQQSRILVLLALVDSVLQAVAFIMVRGGRELHGAVLAVVVACVHVLWVCSQVSASVSVESLLFPVAMVPFVMIRRDLPALRIALSSFAIAVFFVCELAYPEGSTPQPLPAGSSAAFATGNRVLSGLSLLLLVFVIQTNMSATRHILEGAARYGELRATTDELTGVYNRRPIIARLSEWATRGRGNYAIALIDLDHFKTINDEFGHDCGDTILQEVALTLRSHFRETDMVSRWGGDEFLVLMPGVRHADVVPVLERLRRAINLIEKRCPEHTHHVSVSIGAAMGTMGQTPDECIAAADHALYRAKAEGRDTVVAVGVMEATPAQGRPSPDAPISPPPGYINQR